MNNIYEIIRSDLIHYYGHGAMLSKKAEDFKVSLRSLAKALLDIDYRIVFLYRVSTYLITRVKWLGVLIYFRLKSRYGCDLSPYARIGFGLRFVHAFGVVIGPNVELGDNCVIFAGVVLGNRRPDRVDYEMPKIGSQVILGAGCKVLGLVNVPSLTMVGANVVLTSNSVLSSTKGVTQIANRKAEKTI